ncbi:MAG: LD-carboxypeptidase, partial [Duodenibacillus sp.]
MIPSVTHPTIVLAAPSRALLHADGKSIDMARIAQTRANLETMGWRVRCADNLTALDRGLAGSDAVRARALSAAFADPATDIVLALRGGCGASRLLELLDWNVIAQSEAVLVGLSDVTALHLAFLARLGKPGWQGPVGHWFANASSPCRSIFTEAISQKGLHLCVIAQGKAFAAEGMLWGGNLTVLTSLL